MMQCQICGDVDGPFEITDYKNRVVLACERCDRKEKKKHKRKPEKPNNYYEYSMRR